MTYREKLTDPRWQEKRIEVITKHDGLCTECGLPPDECGSLEVHHTTYARGFEPWEYPTDTLLPLCSRCHKERQVVEDEARFEFGRLSARLRIVHVYELSKRLRFLANMSDNDPDSGWRIPPLFDGAKALFDEMRKHFPQ